MPPSVEYCHSPCVAGLAALPVMAMPANGLAVEPLVTVSVVSEKTGVNRDVTVLPGVTRVTLPLAIGASLIAVTVVVSGTVAALIGVEPPLAETSAEVLSDTGPLESSISRTVRPPGVPFQLATGTNSSIAVDGRMIAVVSPRPLVGIAVQVVPP